MTELIPTPLLKRPPGRPKKKRAPNGSRRYLAITLFLDPALITALDTQYEAEGLESRSELVRKACREYLRRVEKRAARAAE